MGVRIQEARGPATAEADVEIVERKGLGHPDTVCDAVMEEVCLGLCRAYLERFGQILHHNCDKGCLMAGQTEVRLGGGRVAEPMRLVIGDRATAALDTERVDVAGIAVESAKAWLRAHLPRIDPERHVRYQVELRPGHPELAALFRRHERVLGANDTSAAVGFAPLTETEKLALEAERRLNSPAFKEAFPEAGEDVKVMAVRTGRCAELTVSLALVDRYVESESRYFERKGEMRGALEAHLRARLDGLDDVSVTLNHLDRAGAGLGGMFLTVLGTSAEHGDSGQVGRGNNVTGFVSLTRPQSSESAAGKNPLSHVGKIYSVLAQLLARALHERVAGLREVTVWMGSRIGEPVDRPWLVAVRAHLAAGAALSDVARPIEEVVGAELARMPEFCRELAEGRHRVC